MELQSTHCSQSKRGNSRRLNDTEKGTCPFSSHVDFELKKITDAAFLQTNKQANIAQDKGQSEHRIRFIFPTGTTSDIIMCFNN